MPRKKRKLRREKTTINRQISKTRNSPAPTHSSVSKMLIQRARADPKSLSRQDVATLQRTIGNQATKRLLSESGRQAPAGLKQEQVIHSTNGTAVIQLGEGRLLKGYRASDEPVDKEKKKKTLKSFFVKVGNAIKKLIPKKKKGATERTGLLGQGMRSEQFEEMESPIIGSGEKEEGETGQIAFADVEEEKSRLGAALIKSLAKSDKEDLAELEGQDKLMEESEKAVQIEPLVMAEVTPAKPVSQERESLLGRVGEQLSLREKLMAVKDFRGEVKDLKSNAEAIPEAFKEITTKTPEVPKEATGALEKFFAPLTNFAAKVAPIIDIIKAVIGLGKSVFSFAGKTKTLIAFDTARKQAKIQIDLLADKIGHPLAYAVKKVFRGVVSRGADVLSKLYDLIATVVGLIPQAKPWTALISAIKDTAMGLVTIGRSLKGFGKWLMGTRGKHRQLASESILKTMLEFEDQAHFDLVKKLAQPGKVKAAVAQLKQFLIELLNKIQWPKWIQTKLGAMAQEEGHTVQLRNIFEMLPEDVQQRLEGDDELKGVILDSLAEAMKSQ